jgi:hypothetical protein
LGGKIILAHTIAAAQQILETKIWQSAFYFIFHHWQEFAKKRN